MSDETKPTILDRTLGNLLRAWTDISPGTRLFASDQPRPDMPDDDLARVRREMEASIESAGDEIAMRGRAAGLGRIYVGLNETGRTRYLNELANGFDVDHDRVDSAIEQVRASDDRASRRQAEINLRHCLEPRWRALLGRFTTLPDGVKFLVDLRADMLRMRRGNEAIAGLAEDLRRMLIAWFDIGLLDMRRIDWSSPAALLEKLIAYESVHAIRSWDDLKNRLRSDRRCFAFFHLNMPDEPLIFLEVALVDGMSSSVDRLLDETIPEIDPRTANAAIFYSISNAQRGLIGISFGNFLIKRVVEVLQQEFPKLKTFATLSPLPAFADWLAEVMEEEDAVLLEASDRRQLQFYTDATKDGAMVQDLLGRADWQENIEIAAALKNPLLRLAARYLVHGKARGGRVRDAVGHFHLSNGARIERLNWLADRSRRGMRQSYGIMINYLYRPGDIESNSVTYLSDRKVARSATIRALLRK